MPTSVIEIEPLKTILRMELRSGCRNTVVIGGLDKFLTKWSKKNSPYIHSTEILAAFNAVNLSNRAYASWDHSRREMWLSGLLRWLENSEKGGNSKKDIRQELPSEATSLAICLDSPLTSIKGIKTALGTKLNKMGLRTIRDLLYFFPRRYVDYSNKKSIAQMQAEFGTVDEQTVFAMIWESNVVKLGKKKGTEIIIGDATGTARAVWFNQPFLARSFKTNTSIMLTGKVSVYKGQIVFESPEWELIEPEESEPFNLLLPVYSLTSGIYPRQMRGLVKRALEEWGGFVPEFLPEEIRMRNNLPGISQAIYQVHYPESHEKLAAARRRFAFDELFLIQLGVLNRKSHWHSDQPGHAFKTDKRIIDNFISGLPFVLTGDQNKALSVILNDVKKPKAMSRLLQGDVGSGKTVIAIVSLLAAAASGYQGALMAPTEILAEQHYTNICKLLSGLSSCKLSEGNFCHFKGFLKTDIGFALLTGKTTEKERSQISEKIENGLVDIVIGTHALIQKNVVFKNLGLAVVDEQHRFGVMQRSALRQKGFNPHLLVMTATPIPRTLALTVYGDLDISVIRELPPGRQIIKTQWFKYELRERVYEFIREQVKLGHQAFIICPLIEESDNIEAKAAITEYRKLSGEIFPDFTLGLLHGKMSSSEKDDVMAGFRDGSIDILVSTPVVEVGIDIPNATVMLIECADRFGLAQLHQFRGRVGRGKSQSYCLLLSEASSAEGAVRLKWMEKIHDGFKLAEKDLEMRGPGEFFGTKQSGLPDLKMAKLSDVNLLTVAREEAIMLFEDHSNLYSQEKTILVKELARVWPNTTEWS